MCCTCLYTKIISAEEEVIKISGSIYKYADNKNFVVSDGDKKTVATDKNSMGTIEISGKLFENPINDNSYISESDAVSITYRLNNNWFSEKEEDWHIISSNIKNVNNINTSKKIGSGSLIIQTSADGDKWVNDIILTDAFKDKESFDEPVYTINSMQLENGCFVKVSIAYTLERKTGTKKILFITTDVKETKQIVEEYIFYIEGNSKDNITIDSSPRKEFRDVVNTGKDTGYTQNNVIDNKDPHFGWSLGYFTINGYTREKVVDDTPIYLKNYGDKVTLWFTLLQDIDCLNGNENLIIAEDTNGFDNEFKVGKINFKHGTLIIRYTDENSNTKQPIVYTDFLAANTTTSADTKVQLFEEGDYEVTLDYELEEKSGIGSIIKTYNDYKISFSFKIRNGNNMVFPFDLTTGNELSNNSITENGFRLDLAESKYLTIDVTKSTIKEGSNKLLSADIRFNRPSKDGDEFTDEGMYTITVKNLYTDSEPTVKTIYVGTNKYLKALAKYNLTLESLNEQIRNGAKVSGDGTLSNTSLKSSSGK